MKGLCKKLLTTATLITACGMLFVGCGDTSSSSSSFDSVSSSHSSSSLESTLDSSSSSSVESTVAPVVLENFENEEKQVLLDDSFTLPAATVKDENGNEYDVEYTAATESGKPVSVIDGAIWVTEFETHYISCQAVVQDEIKTRILTLTVKDEGAPTLTFGTFYDGFEGENYLLPDVMVSDSSNEEITPTVKVYLLDEDTKGKEILCDGTSFTPSVAGYYLVEATAKDSSGNSAINTEVLRIRPQTAKTTILSFESQVDVDKVDYRKNNTRELISKEWLPNFAGEKNVVQVCFEGDAWAPQFYFYPMQDLRSVSCTLFDKYDYAIMRMYMVKTDEYSNAWDGIKLNGDASATTMEFNQWIDYKFPLSAFADGCAEDGTMKFYESNSLNLKDPVTGEKTWRKGMFYIAGIYAVNEATVSVSNVETSSEMEIKAKDSTGENIDLTQANVRVVSPDGVVERVKNARFTPTMQGRYMVYVSGDGYWGRTTGNPSEILSFDYERDITNYVKKDNKYTREWLSEYQGETGVMKVTYTAGTQWTPAFVIGTPLQNIHAIEKYTHVVVRMYVVQSDAVKNIWNSVGMQTTSNVSSTEYQPNTWVDYKFTIEQLKNDSANVGQIKICGNAGSLSYDDYETTAPERTGEFYVAGIWLINES